MVQEKGPDLPPSLLRHPDLDSWVQINKDETISICSGKVEIGQGIQTAVAQLAAEELDVDLNRIRNTNCIHHKLAKLQGLVNILP